MSGTYDLELTVLHGRDLAVKDVSTSDPYIKFDVEGKQYKTKTISSTLNPDWNQKFKFPIKPGTKITFNCWDHDVVGSDDKMGVAVWTCPTLVNGQEVIAVLKNDMKGQITIKAKCLAGGETAVNILKPARDPAKRQTVLFQIKSVENLEQMMAREKLKDPQRIFITLRGATTTTVCGINKWAHLKSLQADKRDKATPRDCYFETILDLEKVEVSVLASQKAKNPQEVMLANGSIMVKLMKDKEKVYETVELSNGVKLYCALQCMASVWDNVQTDVIDKYFRDAETKLTEMKDKNLFTSCQQVAPVEKKPAKKEEKKPAQQPQQQQMPNQMYGSYMQGIQGMQPGMMQPGMMGMQPMMQTSVAVAQPAVAVAQPPVVVAQPAVAVAQPAVAVAQPAVVAAQPAVMGAGYVMPGQFM